jgi:hypothetical protein
VLRRKAVVAAIKETAHHLETPRRSAAPRT